MASSSPGAFHYFTKAPNRFTSSWNCSKKTGMDQARIDGQGQAIA